LVDFGDKRYIGGFNGLVEGFLDDKDTKIQAINNLDNFLKGCK